MRGKILGIFLLAASSTAAHQEAWVQQGKALGAGGIAAPTTPTSVPGFQGVDVPEAQMSAEALGDAAKTRLYKEPKNTASEILLTTEKKRPQVSVTPEDPLLKEADSLMVHPEKVIGGQWVEQEVSSKDVTRHQCRRSPSLTVTVEEDLVVKPVVLKRKVEVGRWWERTRWKRRRHIHGKITPLSVKEVQKIDYWFEDHNWHREFYDIYYEYQLQKGHVNEKTGAFEEGAWIPVTKETYEAAQEASGHEGWRSLTPAAEERVACRSCRVVSQACVDGPSTKIIEGVKIHKPCWRRQTVYACEGLIKDACASLERRGCAQVDSRCVQKEKGRCVVYENVYECRKGLQKRRMSLKGAGPYGLDAKGLIPATTANHDLTDVLSKLAIFRDLQKQMDGKTLTIFAGQQKACDKHCVGFSDCCQKAGGWGTDLKLSRCSADEKDLAKRRSQGHCVYVGTFCAEKLKILGTCLRKRSQYCCFGSRLARLVQEQGRRQLGLTFGTAENPFCRPLTVQELARIDFDQLDLREIFDDLTQKVTVPNAATLLDRFQKDWQHRLPSKKGKGGTFSSKEPSSRVSKEKRLVF